METVRRVGRNAGGGAPFAAEARATARGAGEKGGSRARAWPYRRCQRFNAGFQGVQFRPVRGRTSAGGTALPSGGGAASAKGAPAGPPAWAPAGCLTRVRRPCLAAGRARARGRGPGAGPPGAWPGKGTGGPAVGGGRGGGGPASGRHVTAGRCRASARGSRTGGGGRASRPGKRPGRLAGAGEAQGGRAGVSPSTTSGPQACAPEERARSTRTRELLPWPCQTREACRV